MATGRARPTPPAIRRCVFRSWIDRRRCSRSGGAPRPTRSTTRPPRNSPLRKGLPRRLDAGRQLTTPRLITHSRRRRRRPRRPCLAGPVRRRCLPLRCPPDAHRTDLEGQTLSRQRRRRLDASSRCPAISRTVPVRAFTNFCFSATNNKKA